jgi:hypothetical protein
MKTETQNGNFLDKEFNDFYYISGFIGAIFGNNSA